MKAIASSSIWRGDGGVSNVSIFFVFITGVLRGYEFNFCFLGE